MKYKVVVEHDPETGHYAATVPGLPIFVDAESEREVRKLVKEAISFYREVARSRRPAPRQDYHGGRLMPRLPGETDGRRFLRAMARFGWTVGGQRGSHRKLVHADDHALLR
jgi:predicted RNase H-like HicB family nuclease